MYSVQMPHIALSEDCLCNVFSMLNVKDLSVAKRVCSIWESVGKRPLLLATVCREFTFFPSYNAIESKSTYKCEVELSAYQALPKDLLKILTAPCPCIPNNLIFQTHFLLYIPSQREKVLFKTPDAIPIHVQKGKGKQIKEIFDRSQVHEAYWTLTTKKPFMQPDPFLRNCQSSKKEFDRICKKGPLAYDLPTAQEALRLARVYTSLFDSGSAFNIFCKTSLEKKHLILTTGSTHIKINTAACFGDDRALSGIWGVHKLASALLGKEEFTLNLTEGNYFDTLPIEIRKCILNWIPEKQYLDCSLVSKHFFDSKWDDYLKSTSLLLCGSKHAQVMAYAYHFQNFFLDTFKSEFNNQYLFSNLSTCLNTMRCNPTTIFEKITAFKACLPAIKDSLGKSYWHRVKRSSYTDSNYHIQANNFYDFFDGPLADTAVRLLIDEGRLESEIPEVFTYATGNKYILDKTLEIWLKQFKNFSSLGPMGIALSRAISLGRSQSLVIAILCRTELTQHSLKEFYKEHYCESEKNNLTSFCVARHIPPAIVIDKIDYTTAADLHQAIVCKLPFELLVKISAKRKDNLADVESIKNLSHQPVYFWNALLNLAMEVNYAEDYVLFVIKNLPKVSLEQLEKARQKAYSSAVIESLQAKAPQEKCTIS